MLGAGIVFVFRQLDIDLRPLLDALRFESVALPMAGDPYQAEKNERELNCWAGVPWLIDAQQTAAALSSFSPHWIVVDHYSFDSSWHVHLEARLGARLAVIDDLADRPITAEFLIDHNLAESHERKYAGKVSRSIKMLAGPRFALLARAFRDAPKYTFRKSLLSIGIFMGGADQDNLSCDLLLACRQVAKFEGPIEIVSTQFNPHLVQLKRLAAQWPATTISEDLPNLAEFFSRHDLQIGGGGGAAWERAALGAPSMVIPVADNQRAGVQMLAEIGAVATVGETEMSLRDAVGALVTFLANDPARRLRLSVTSRSLVDGFGARRVALCLLNSELRVHPASTRDSAIMFKWRNDLRIRMVSRTAKELDPKDHESWVESSIASSDRCLLMGTIGDLRVGVIRFDRLDCDATEISLYLDPELQGLGLGPFLLRAGEDYLAGRGGFGSLLVATVQSNNLVSRRLFESCGYRYHYSRWEKIIEVRKDGRH